MWKKFDEEQEREMRCRGDDELEALLSSMSASAGGKERGVDPTRRKQQQVVAGALVAPASGALDCSEEEEEQSGAIWNRLVHCDRAVDQDLVSRSALGRSGALVPFCSPVEETHRQQAVSTVRATFHTLTAELGIKLTNEVFEKWQFTRTLADRLEEMSGSRADPMSDPLIPRLSKRADPELMAALKQGGCSDQQAQNFSRELMRACKKAKQWLAKTERGAQGASRLQGYGVSVSRGDGCRFLSNQQKDVLRINDTHYRKMATLFRRHGCSHGCFDAALFACLMRYEGLQGGGMQAALPGPVFDVLLARFDVRMELFASPFNSRYSRFCSAFLGE